MTELRICKVLLRFWIGSVFIYYQKGTLSFSHLISEFYLLRMYVNFRKRTCFGKRFRFIPPLNFYWQRILTMYWRRKKDAARRNDFTSLRTILINRKQIIKSPRPCCPVSEIWINGSYRGCIRINRMITENGRKLGAKLLEYVKPHQRNFKKRLSV